MAGTPNSTKEITNVGRLQGVSHFSQATDTRANLISRAMYEPSQISQVTREGVRENRHLRVALLACRDFHAVPKANEGPLVVQMLAISCRKGSYHA